MRRLCPFIAFVIGLAGCIVNVDFAETEFLCTATTQCPTDYQCDGRTCRLARSADASIDSGETLLDAQACPGPDPEGVVTALSADAPITIDGVLESSWDNARVVTFSNSARSDNDVRVRILWTTSHLFLAFEVSDSSLESVSVANQIFRDDGSEFYLDMLHDESSSLNADDSHYIINIEGVVQDGTLEVGVTTQASGYVIEHALAWSETSRVPVAGETIGLLLGNNDRDNDVPSQFDWLNLIESGTYDRPNLWGDLVLSDAAASELCSARLQD